MNKDSRGNDFLEIDNLRITLVRSANRNPNKDWPGQDVVRFQSKRNSTSNSLHQGAEIPIPNDAKIVEIISALVEIHKIK